MRGNIKIASRWCRACKRQIRAEANSTVWGCGDLLMVLITFGVWIPLRMVLLALSSPWRCSECGRRV